MDDSLDNLYKNQSLIYKYILYFVTIGCIVFFFPKGGKFKYEFQKGKPWQYENLYAPFDFSIKKTPNELVREQKAIEDRQVSYFTYDETIAQEVLAKYNESFPVIFTTDSFTPNQRRRLERIGTDILDDLYKNGLVSNSQGKITGEDLYLVKNNEARRIVPADLNSIGQVDSIIGAGLNAAD